MPAEIHATAVRPAQPQATLASHTQVAHAERPDTVDASAASDQGSRTRAEAAEMQKNVKEAIERLNEQMRNTGRNLNFSMDDKIDRLVITVKNSETGEVVRQIPDEAIVKAAHQIEALKGLLHDSVN